MIYLPTWMLGWFLWDQCRQIYQSHGCYGYYKWSFTGAQPLSMAENKWRTGVISPPQMELQPPIQLIGSFSSIVYRFLYIPGCCGISFINSLWYTLPKMEVLTYISCMDRATHLKNINQTGSSPQVGVKIQKTWNHHLVIESAISHKLIRTAYGYDSGVFWRSRHQILPCQSSTVFVQSLRLMSPRQSWLKNKGGRAEKNWRNQQDWSTFCHGNLRYPPK